MINVYVSENKVHLSWYENGELKKEIHPKRMLRGDKFKKEGMIKRDIYTGEEYRIVKQAPNYIIPPVTIPYPVYGNYDYGLASKLLYFEGKNPDSPRAVFFDIETTSLKPSEGEITSICWLDSYTGEEFYTLNTGDERECLLGFVKYLKEHNILSLIGFNSNNFDIPYLNTRCIYNRVRFNPDKFIKQDVMLIAHKLFYFGSLDVIAQKLGVERKLEVDNPIKLWKSKRYDELIEYNAQDVIVTKQIYEKLNMEDFLKALWKLTWLDYDRVNSNSHICNCFFNKRMWEDDLCVSEANLTYHGDFGGGYNFDTSGIYENVLVYDFASLYPNIIRGLHLSPENYEMEDVTHSSDKNRHLVIKKDAFKGKEAGVLDTYIGELLNLRKKYKKEGKDHEQNAVKILANSVYGVLSQKTAKFVLGGTHLGATVTWAGRNMLQTVSRLAKNRGINTVYGKTDSLFVQSPYSIEETNQIMQEIVDDAWFKVTGTKNTTLSMDFEGLYEKLLVINKNNYAFIKNGKIRTKGGSFKQKTSSQFQKDVTNRILEMILKENHRYKQEIQEELKPFIAEKIATESISYFSIKHKARKKKINIWDTGNNFMIYKGLGEPDYGFYHYACKVICLPPNPPFEVILFPLRYEPKGGFMVDRKWLESQISKILIKLNIEDKRKQIDLTTFL